MSLCVVCMWYIVLYSLCSSFLSSLIEAPCVVRRFFDLLDDDDDDVVVVAAVAAAVDVVEVA